MSVILRAPNTDRLIRGKPKTYLSDASPAGSGTLTVESIAGFGVGDYLILGTIGSERTEIVRVHAVTAPTGSTITLAANTSFRHEDGTVIYLTDFNQVEFSRAATETGSKSVLATSDMTVDSMDTIYDDTANDTGFGFYRFKNEAGSTFGDYSDAIPYAGYSDDAANTIFERALSAAATEISPQLKYENLFDFLNDFISYVNSRSYRWSEAKVLDTELATISTGDWEFDMPTNIARDTDPSAIIGIHVNGYPPLSYIPQRTWNRLSLDMVYTQLASDLADTDTTMSLDNSSGLADTGSVTINGDSIAYTGNTRATNTLTGVTGIATGGHSEDDYVLYRETTGTPISYTVMSQGKIRVWPVCASIMNNRIMRIDYYRAIPKVNSLGDKTLLKVNRAAIDYVAYRIKKHQAGGTLNVDDEEFQQFVANIDSLVDRDMPSEPRRIIVS